MKQALSYEAGLATKGNTLSKMECSMPELPVSRPWLELGNARVRIHKPVTTARTLDLLLHPARAASAIGSLGCRMTAILAAQPPLRVHSEYAHTWYNNRKTHNFTIYAHAQSTLARRCGSIYRKCGVPVDVDGDDRIKNSSRRERPTLTVL